MFVISTSRRDLFACMYEYSCSHSYWHSDNSSEKCVSFSSIGFQFAVITTYSVCVHMLNVICYVHLHTHWLCLVSVCSELLKGFCIKWNRFDWPGLQGPDRDSWEKRKKACGCVCGEGNYTTTCSLSVPLSRLSGPYLVLMRCGNTHRHM